MGTVWRIVWQRWKRAWRHLDIIAIVKRKGNRMLGSDSGDGRKMGWSCEVIRSKNWHVMSEQIRNV